jgi:hypothetical protein
MTDPGAARRRAEPLLAVYVAGLVVMGLALITACRAVASAQAAGAAL